MQVGADGAGAHTLVCLHKFLLLFEEPSPTSEVLHLLGQPESVLVCRQLRQFRQLLFGHFSELSQIFSNR